MRRLVVLGCGGYGRVVEDLLAHLGEWEVAGFVDIDTATHGNMVNGVPVLGGEELIPGLLEQGISGAVVAIGDNATRARLVDDLASRGFELPTLVHPRAFVGRFVQLGDAVTILAGAVINTGSVIGRNVVINVQASVDHDCVVGDHAHIWPGANLAGNVVVGEYSFIGTGSSVIPQVRIGRNTLVGAGAAVVRDLPDNVVAVGVPARAIRSRSTL
jgi:UDP-perosamine 4-acetyltransferase